MGWVAGGFIAAPVSRLKRAMEWTSDPSRLHSSAFELFIGMAASVSNSVYCAFAVAQEDRPAHHSYSHRHAWWDIFDIRNTEKSFLFHAEPALSDHPVGAGSYSFGYRSI